MCINLSVLFCCKQQNLIPLPYAKKHIKIAMKGVHRVNGWDLLRNRKQEVSTGFQKGNQGSNHSSNNSWVRLLCQNEFFDPCFCFCINPQAYILCLAACCAAATGRTCLLLHLSCKITQNKERKSSPISNCGATEKEVM